MVRRPVLIQGGMGVGVSDWRLANAVSSAGQLGVVSGTGIDTVMVRRLQSGDAGGHMRRALRALPIRGVAEGIIDRYFEPGGKQPTARFRPRPMFKVPLSRRVLDLLVASNFAEVFLAKEGHRNPVGINLLEKIQVPTLASLYGAMLAGVDYVLMGAGIPRAVPAVLDRLADGLRVRLQLDVKGAAPGTEAVTEFDPVDYSGGDPPPVRRPLFLAIVSSHVLATMLVRKVESKVDGFVVEAPTAGGHNAPPRNRSGLSEAGEPVYGERDAPDLDVIRDLGRPFWLAGMRAEPEAIAEALDLGATGVQVGTAFAYCEESGFDPEVKRRVLELARQGRAKVFTDPVASPTGFPFKVVELAGTLAAPDVYAGRDRICDLGYLRAAYGREDDSIGWRCPAEPVEDYVRKGGAVEDTVGRKCLCNALMSSIGLGQTRGRDDSEPLLVTSGDDVAGVARFVPEGADSYTAADVIDYLLAGIPGSRNAADPAD
jgi:nitronate monooxygenase